MKKIFTGVIIFAITLSLSGCGIVSNPKQADNNDETNENTENTGSIETNYGEELEKILANAVDYKASDYVELCNYKGVEVNTYVSDEDLQNRINDLLKQNSKYEELEGTVKRGDILNINYSGSIDGVAFDGGTAEGQTLEIGSHTFIDGFEEQLIGMNTGETKDIEVTFPDPYENNPDLAGKPAVFTVKVNYIQGKEIIPEYNDEFVKESTDKQYKTTKEYDEKLKKDLLAEKQANIRDEAFIYVLDHSTVKEVPDFLVDLMKLRLDASYKTMANQYGYESFDKFVSDNFGGSVEEYNKQLESTAKTYVEQQLITKAIAEKEKITISDEEYADSLKSYMEGNNITSEEEMEKYSIDNYASKLSDLINETVVMNKVIDFVEENAVEVKKPVSDSQTDEKSE